MRQFFQAITGAASQSENYRQTSETAWQFHRMD